MPANVFVPGLDELNLETLHKLPHPPRCHFHSLLSVEELVEPDEIDLETLLEKAQRQLESFHGDIDAVIGYRDFPVSTMVPILCRRLGLPTTPLTSVVTCEHKYWSRLEQQKVIDEYPRFGLVDLQDSPEPPAGMNFPLWLKPVKSFSSQLAYKVTDRHEFARAAEAVRSGIGRVGNPFDYVLSMLDPPAEIAEAGGKACLAEEAVDGEQLTVEGYTRNGRVHPYGVIDSINYEGTSSFLRYQYPSQLPEHVKNRVVDISERVIRQVGLDAGTFNIEYFWNREQDRINLLEINPRLSQSHARLFECVDGAPNHQCMVRLALGRPPELPYRRGTYNVAGKWFLRRFCDGVVRRLPSAEEITSIQQEIPGVTVDLIPGEGTRLSDLPGQDSYSYELADVFVGADDQAELTDKYERCVRALHFEFAE